MAVQYAPLFALETQFQAKNGRNLTGGFLRVFYAATDDPADTYSDYNLTRNPDRIVLDDNGRALVICDKSKAYRLEVYDAEGMLLWTEEPVYCSGTGGGGVSITKVISTDGSIAIDESVAGSTTTYDIGLAPRDNDEFLEWIKCSEEDCGSTWYPVYQGGTMETEAGQGVKVHGGHLYHFTNSFTVDPNGSGINYDTFRVTMYCGDNIVDERDFDIDSSLNDPVLCEFSRDVVPTEDTHVYFKLSIPATCEVSGEVQCHRIYSGVNAVPDTCATKQWVQETFDYNLSSKVDYSAIEYNGYGQISGISGSAIAGGLDSATVSSIASSVASAYTESAFSSISSWTAEFSSISSKADQSALTAYQPVSAMSGYATEAYVDAKVGDKLDATASSLFLTGLPDDLATTGDVASAVSGKLDKSAASGEFYPMTGNPSGFLTAHQSLAGLATVEYVDSSVSSKLDTSAFASASAGFAPTGDYAYNSSLSAYYPASASGAFQPSGQYQTAGDYALNSAVSAKLDASASSNFVVNSAMTSWIPYSALDYSGTAISGIGGSSLAGMGGGGADYTGVYPINVDNTAREIAVDSLPLVTDSSMTSYASGDSSVIGVNLDIMSGKLDKTAQVVTATATQLYAGTAYLTSVNGAPVSASRAGNAANASLANSAYYDGTGRLISSLPDRAEVSAIASAYATGGGGGVAYTSPSGTIVVAGNTLEGTNSAALTAASGGYVEKLPLATFPDVTISTSPIQITYGNLPNTSTGGEFILDFSSPLYGGTLFISGRDSAYNTVSASAGLGTDTYTASVPQGPIVNQIYAWTDGSWLHLGSDITASAAPQVITTGVGQLAWHSALTGVSSTVANNSAAWGQGGVSPSTVSSIASSYAESAASSKLDTLAFSTVSGSFLTAVPAGYASETYVDSSVSSKLDTSAFSAASGSFLTAVPAGYATEAYVDSSVTSKMDSTAVQSAYASASASQATAQGVLYILIPDDV